VQDRHDLQIGLAWLALKANLQLPFDIPNFEFTNTLRTYNVCSLQVQEYLNNMGQQAVLFLSLDWFSSTADFAVPVITSYQHSLHECTCTSAPRSFVETITTT
jgi:hypothetical protein